MTNHQTGGSNITQSGQRSTWSLTIGASLDVGAWCLVLLFGFVALGNAQPFAIDWFTIDGDGGRSTDGCD